MSKQNLKLTQEQLQKIIQEELSSIQGEGFWRGAGAAAARYLPGGGAALDYSRSQSIEEFEKKHAELEVRVATLERR